jgi:hypothetical protein
LDLVGGEVVSRNARNDYGFWTASAKAACPETETILLDLNLVVMELARRNVTTLGLNSNVHFVVGDAEFLVRDLRDVDPWPSMSQGLIQTRFPRITATRQSTNPMPVRPSKLFGPGG